jgi:phosphatidylinositol glycan class V
VPAESLYTLVGLVVNVVAFCIAAVALHRCDPHRTASRDACAGTPNNANAPAARRLCRLSLATLQQNADLANLSVLLFCFNPASVFYSAVYTEAIFAACTWSGLALLPTRHWAGVAALAAAGAARSNGILACWFLLHALAAECVRRKGVPPALVLRAAASCALVVAPYVAMQGAAAHSAAPRPPLPPSPVCCAMPPPQRAAHATVLPPHV